MKFVGRAGLVLILALSGTLLMTSPALADGPGSGAPWLVSVGDSYISGEAGRWAGNTSGPSAGIDALGPTAYYDNATNTGEEVSGCHRAKSAEIHIGGGVNSKNLACSGATTSTNALAIPPKPGVDFYHNPITGLKGQALLLQEFAASHNVAMVVVSIGGNDFGFASVIAQCVLNYTALFPLLGTRCKDNPLVNGNISPANVTAVTNSIAAAFDRIRVAMSNAGYADAMYKVVVQNYEQPLPFNAATTYRYPESTGFIIRTYPRQIVGGCGFTNADSDWAASTVLSTVNNAVANAAAQSGPNIVLLNLASAFKGRLLCENTVRRLNETSLGSGIAVGASDQLEWISEIRTLTALPPYSINESLHPNYWGQLAVRNCVRQVYNSGSPVGGSCVRAGTGINSRGEPNMSLS